MIRAISLSKRQNYTGNVFRGISVVDPLDEIRHWPRRTRCDDGPDQNFDHSIIPYASLE